MSKDFWEKAKERAKEYETIDVKEKLWTNRIVRIILLSSLLILLLLFMIGYFYINDSLSPVDANNQAMVEVTIPFDSTTDDVGQILKDKGIIKNADIFAFYLKANNSESLQAGHYQFNPAMSAKEVMEQLQKGGEPIFVDADTTITVVEGITIEAIAEVVGEKTAISPEDFLATAQDGAFIERLSEAFPSLLAGLSERENLNYVLEGYLFPATYEYFVGMTAEELITEMVAAANLNYQRLVDDMANTYLDYHQILTLASLIEQEAITNDDRALVSGVFYNRLEIDMPLQTDVSILYALGEHKEFVTYSDLEVESPYNTYMYTGLPPGPVNTPSYSAISAAIYPNRSDYYYFVANIDTQEIFFSSTIEEHDALVEQYVNNRSESDASAIESDETFEDTEVVEEETEFGDE